MPFTSGGQTFRGGNYLFAGMSGLGKGIGEVIKEMQQAQQDVAADDLIIQHSLKNGQISPEEYTKFLSGSRTQKNGIVAGLARNFAMDLAQQQLETQKAARAAQEEQRRATADLRTQQAAAFNWTPDEAARQAARWTNNELVQTGPGKFQPVPYGGSGSNEEVTTDPLKIDGQIIPGIGVNRKTGQYVYFGGMTGGEEPVVKIDPKTGLPYYRDPKGAPHFLTGNQAIAGQMLYDISPQATPTPAPSTTPLPKNIEDVIFGGATPTPAGASAAAAKDNDVANVRQRAIAILTQARKPVTEANIQAVIKKLGGG